MKEILNILKALGEENRFRIVMMLRERSLCVCEFCEVLDISLSTVSSHLKQLSHAGILKSRKVGRWVVYALTEEPSIRELIERVRKEVKDEEKLNHDLLAIREVNPAKSCAVHLRGEGKGNGCC